jgi:hypothetical protein
MFFIRSLKESLLVVNVMILLVVVVIVGVANLFYFKMKEKFNFKLN